MARKHTQGAPAGKPANTSVAGEEDPGAALDAGDETARSTPGTGHAVCHRCDGSGRFNNAPCPTCGGTGKVPPGLGG